MSASKSRPIGVFDSGIGGLTVANAISGLLPEETIIYFGDTEHLPYGDKSVRAIEYFSENITSFLKDKGCKMVVIACNTASSIAYDVVKAKFADDLIVMNVVDPIVDGVLADRGNRRIGIIGTKGTIRNGAYERKLKEADPDLIVTSQSTPLLAQMIEEGFYDSDISKAIVGTYVDRANFKDIDAMILACTHYPLIKADLKALYGDAFRIYDSTHFVAEAVKNKLTEHDLLNKKRTTYHQFFVSDYTDSFEAATKIFYREKIHLEYHPIWELKREENENYNQAI